MRFRAVLPLMVLVLTTGCGYAGMEDLPLPGGPDLGKDSYVVTADFANVLDLAEQSTVRVDGVTVGRVERITRKGWNARVTLRLRGSVVLPADSQARISQTSLLGEKFVDLTGAKDPGRPTLAGGDNIALVKTSRGSEVEEVLGALSLLLNGGGVAQLKTISKELHAAMDSGAVDTRTFLSELDAFVTTLDRNKSTIVTTLENVNRLSATINDDHATVTRALTDFGPGLQVLTEQQKQLVSMLAHLSSFGDVSSEVIRTAGADMTADLSALQPILASLEKSGDTLPQVLEDILSFPFPDAVLDAVKGDYVNLAVEIDLSPFVLLNNVSGGKSSDSGMDPPPPSDGLAHKPWLPDAPGKGTSANPPSSGSGVLGLFFAPLLGPGS